MCFIECTKQRRRPQYCVTYRVVLLTMLVTVCLETLERIHAKKDKLYVMCTERRAEKAQTLSRLFIDLITQDLDFSYFIAYLFLL